MSRAGSLIERFAPLSSLARTAFGQLRVVAYHDVPDSKAFARHLEPLVKRYKPVTEAMVVEAIRSGRDLPRRAIWITFDDGHPSVLENAQPVLDRLGVSATVFVCPGLIGTSTPMWWEIIEEGQRRGVGPSARLTDLKRLPDSDRRHLVEAVAGRLEEKLGHPFTRPQLTTTSLKRWLEAGHGVGNHSWDHPCLDQCSADEEERQLRMTHDWLVQELGLTQPVFAYPNGNWSNASDRTLRDLGYPLALLFDHRLTDLSGDPMRLSRLRLSADAPVGRAQSIVSGAHPLLFHAGTKLGVVDG